MLGWFGQIKGFIASLSSSLSSPIAEIFRSALITTVKDTAGFLVDQVPFGGVLRKLAGLGTGGVVRSSGALVVGEYGPELVNLPRGATVTPNQAPASAVDIDALVREIRELRAEFRRETDRRVMLTRTGALA